MFTSFIKATSKFSKDATRNYGGCIKLSQKADGYQELTYTNGFFCWKLIIKLASTGPAFDTIIPLNHAGYLTCDNVTQYPDVDQVCQMPKMGSDDDEVAKLNRAGKIREVLLQSKIGPKTHISCFEFPAIHHSPEPNSIRADWLAAFLSIMDKKDTLFLSHQKVDHLDVFQVKNRKFELTGWFVPVSGDKTE